LFKVKIILTAHPIENVKKTMFGTKSLEWGIKDSFNAYMAIPQE
jgi:hypothetical protein